jgi:DUF4097 and DUF4098 domain-containing protein YvlB
MRAKNIVSIGAFGALFIVCGLCALTAFGTVDWMRRNITNIDGWEFGGQSAQVTENRTFGTVPNLEITSDHGDIQVTAANVNDIEVEMVKTSWAATVEEAKANAQAMTVRVTEGTDTLTLVYDKPEEINIGGRNGPDSIDFIVRVPAETSVHLKTSFGKVEISGLVGAAEIESDFGNLEVENLTGTLEARSRNASIMIKQVEAGDGPISVETSFGGITVEDLTGNEIKITSSNGPIMASNLTAKESIQIENQFGEIEVLGVEAATLTIENSNGKIRIDTGQTAELVSASTRFGDVQVTNVESPAYELSISNGDLSVENATGSLILENSFGDITIMDASNVSLDVKGSNGSISFTGSLNLAAHTIKNSFGDITLTIPADSSFNVVLDTSFGNIESEIPLSLTGTLDTRNENNHWEASMNGGGPELNASTSNGDITIQVLSSGE